MTSSARAGAACARVMIVLLHRQRPWWPWFQSPRTTTVDTAWKEQVLLRALPVLVRIDGVNSLQTRQATAQVKTEPHSWRATATTPTSSSPEPDLRGRFEEDDRLAVDKEESLSQPMTCKTASQS